jgi:3-oxoacyl-[acyl-carrier-protein] synthase III
MPRSVIVGSGAFIPPNLVTNDMLSRIMDTTDEWIQQRSGVETRYYVDEGMSSSDLGFAAATQAIQLAGIDKNEVDLVVFATMTPDHYFPGCGGLLQSKLGIKDVPCFDIRQQCAGFLYGMQLADVQIRAGAAKTVLLVGAETHTGFMPWTKENYEYLYGRIETPPTPEEYEWNTRFRNVTVLFGDGGAAVVIKAEESGDRGVVDCILRTNGSDYERIYVPGAGFKHRPYVDADQIKRGDHIPVMNGMYVYRSATHAMVNVTREILERNNLKLDDVSMVLMHQANKRINERVQKMLEIPDEKVISNIHKYGNTTAATIPLLWNEAVRTDRIHNGDLILMVAFGAGMNWGALLLRA